MRLIAPATALLVASCSIAMADCNHPTAISVARGASESTVEADAPATTIDCYQLAAKAGQEITVTVAGAKDDAVFAVFAPGWRATCDAADDCDINGDQMSADEAKTWSDTAPATGAYLIVIDNSRSDSSYQLNVELH